ncbi:MAG: ElyC/SanA/YdcF family protein [Propionibacteriaceae bacterium]|nr:ElyC/SanA/YdcF family protein [Propionibacteriaceae bacterium]
MSKASPKARKPRRRGLEVLGAATLTIALGSILSGIVLVLASSSGRVYVAGDDVPARDVIMVLGAQADPGSPSGFLGARLDVAIDLFNSGKGKVILVTGDNREQSNFETQVMQDYLVKRGIPANKIVQDVAGYDTYDSCSRARDVFGVREVTVVSQLYHVERTVATCRVLGVDAIGVGDVSAKQIWPGLHQKAELREYLAVVKMQLDLLRGNKATQSPPSSAVQDALKA